MPPLPEYIIVKLTKDEADYIYICLFALPPYPEPSQKAKKVLMKKFSVAPRKDAETLITSMNETEFDIVFKGLSDLMEGTTKKEKRFVMSILRKLEKAKVKTYLSKGERDNIKIKTKKS